ncbi:unnamed protein product, partial [marine sediment metagenome]
MEMIRFTCQHCGEPVRVPDTSGGKKGRCPFCKGVAEIPGPSAPSDEVADLAAALSGDEPADQKPPPPPSPEDLLAETEAEPELSPLGDPSTETDRLDAIEAAAPSTRQVPAAAERGRPDYPDPQQAKKSALAFFRKIPLKWLIVVAAVAVVLIAAAVVLFIRA